MAGEYETLRWPTNLDRAGIEKRLLEVRTAAQGQGLDSLARLFDRIEALTSAQLGAAVAERWKFAPAVRDAIEFHHDPASAPPEHQALASLLYVADTLCCQAKEGFYLTGQNQAIESNTTIGSMPVTREIIARIQQELSNLIGMMAPFAD